MLGKREELIDAHPGPVRESESSVAWIPTHELEYVAWASTGRRLGMVGRCSQWWLGDWMRYGSARWGERYSKAARLTGYDVQSLRNMSYVAARFHDVSRRRDGLSWSHHAEVAALDPAEQDRWLERAISERLSVADLRVELRQRRALAHDTSEEEAQQGEAALEPIVVCPHCDQAFTLEAADVARVCGVAHAQGLTR